MDGYIPSVPSSPDRLKKLSKAVLYPLKKGRALAGFLGKYYKDNFTKPSYWRDVGNFALMYSAHYSIAESLFAGMKTMQMILNRGGATGMNIVAGPLFAEGHRWALKKMKITDASSNAKRLAGNLAYLIPAETLWVGALYKMTQVEHFWTSLSIGVPSVIPLALVIVNANAALNYLATSKDKYLDVFGQKTAENIKRLTVNKKRRLAGYVGVMGTMTAVTLTGWFAGPKIRAYALEKMGNAPEVPVAVEQPQP